MCKLEKVGKNLQEKIKICHFPFFRWVGGHLVGYAISPDVGDLKNASENVRSKKSTSLEPRKKILVFLKKKHLARLVVKKNYL